MLAEPLTLPAFNREQIRPLLKSTLSCLAGLGWPLMKQLIKDGRIHPSLSFGEASVLIAEYAPRSVRKPLQQSSFRRRLARFARFVCAKIESLSAEGKADGATELLGLVERLGARAGP